MKNRLLIIAIFLFLLSFALYFLNKSEKEILIKEVLIQDQEINQEKRELSKERIIYYINQERLGYGLIELKQNDLLDQIALIRVQDMIENDYFEHINQKEFESISNQLNYNFLLLGENIAKGYFSNNRTLVNAWLNSPSHRENILNKDYQETGVAIKDYENGKMVVQIFALPTYSSFLQNQFFLVNINFQKTLANILAIFE